MDLYSLRSRYAMISIILGLLVLFAVITGHYLLSHTRKESALHIDNREHLLAQSREIRNDVWQSQQAIGQFLIEPQHPQNRARLNAAIAATVKNIQGLLDMKDRLSFAQLAQIKHIAALSTQLRKATSKLVKIRLDTHLEYPSLILARDSMLPRQQKVFDAFTTAIDETIANDVQKTPDFKIYHLLIHARYRWSSIISEIRLLIVGRLGSYGMETMPSQKQNIQIYFNDFYKTMQELKAMRTNKHMGFSTSIAIDTIIKQSNAWYKNYLKFVNLHNPTKWRSDSLQLHEQINPILEKIWTDLQKFDSTLEHGAEDDIHMLSTLAQQQDAMIWGIGIVGFIFVIIGYFVFDKTVLSPMLMLSNAFLQEARTGSDAELPKQTSTETRDLIRAFTEMRNQIHNRQQALEHQAQHDSLTGLANRSLLYRELSEMINHNKRHTDEISLIMLDLDRFKEANDALGHHIGDQLLIEVGRRLREELRGNDLVARLGGDEFAILMGSANEEQAKNVCKKILKCFEKAFEIQDQQLFVGASLGIAVHPQHGHDAETMMKRADIAMYVAKRNHLGFAFYEPSSDNYDTRYLSLPHDLRKALNDESLDIAYQLKYDVATNQPVSAEALLRWHHPQLGDIPPSDIIPLAEQLGLMNRLTHWVMRTALAQCAEWHRQGILISMAINFSVYDLLSMELIQQISNLLEQHKVPPEHLIIEVTENAMLIDPANAISILQKLDDMGLRISVDDFGAGFSSLGYLKKLPVDELKIDKSFVMDMTTDDNDAVIVRSTIDLAHNLGLKVVAEGVENEEIYDLLRILRCDTAQGFYLSRPASPDAISKELMDYQQFSPRSSRLGQ